MSRSRSRVKINETILTLSEARFHKERYVRLDTA